MLLFLKISMFLFLILKIHYFTLFQNLVKDIDQRKKNIKTNLKILNFEISPCCLHFAIITYNKVFNTQVNLLFTQFVIR